MRSRSTQMRNSSNDATIETTTSVAKELRHFDNIHCLVDLLQILYLFWNVLVKESCLAVLYSVINFVALYAYYNVCLYRMCVLYILA